MKTALALLAFVAAIVPPAPGAEPANPAAAASLPALGKTLTVDDVRKLCAAEHWDDLALKIEANPPPKPFVTGSCLGWTDEWARPALHRAWLRHGLEYWAGLPGDDIARLHADTALMLAVAEALRADALAQESANPDGPKAVASNWTEKALVVFNRAHIAGADEAGTFGWGSGRRLDPPPLTVGRALANVGKALLPRDVPGFVRPYEPTTIGVTKDRRDETFMDFQLSMMFPLYGSYPEPLPPEFEPDFHFGDFDFRHPDFFASATIRAGQYIETRPSSPVVGKRFNPQLFVRFWARDRTGQASSPGNYLDFMYGHESNGQAIGTPEEFLAQKEVYRSLEKFPDTLNAEVNARRWAHDSISRGWDYVGAEVGWNWRAAKPIVVKNLRVDVERSLRVKVRYFLPWGFLQKHAEQYYSWEGEGAAHPRRNYDGIKIQYFAVSNVLGKLPLFTGRSTYTYTTGLSHPFQHSTFEADLGFKLGALPLSLWGRIGYNSDLTDYYHMESGYGFRLSLWNFDR